MWSATGQRRIDNAQPSRPETGTSFRYPLAGPRFAELAKATEWIRALPPPQSSEDLTVLPPAEKIALNELSPESAHVITGALANVGLVGQCVEDQALDDPDFPERLKSGFLAEYHRQRQQGVRRDELFERMCVASQRGMQKQAKRCWARGQDW